MKKATQAKVDREELRAIVREEIRALFAAVTSPALNAYSTRKGCGPEGWEDGAWKSVAASIPGAYVPRDASGKAGRWTIVPREAFAAWERAQAGASPLSAANDAAEEEVWSPRAALESVGLRRSR